MKTLMLAWSLLAAMSSTTAKKLVGDAEPMTNLAIVYPKVDCKSLVSLNITDAGGAGSFITSAYHTTKSGIRYCAVDGKLASDISFTVLLPVATWTQRYMQTGCGGFCGMVDIHMSVADGSPEVSKGEFVVSSNDMAGGTGNAKWGLIRNRRVDFAYLANHLNALAAKKIIKTFYGKGPAYSYFNGCSDGGREAVMEAIRYPDDFNGIIAGAPAMMWLIQNTFHHAWQTLSNLDDKGYSILHWSKKSLIHSAGMEACDHLDGLVDGLLQDPRLCDFDPASIQCPDDSIDCAKCLTSAEVDAVRKMYAGSVDKTTGQHLTQGEGMYGSESGWNLPFFSNDSNNYGFGVDMVINTLRYFAFECGVPDNFTLRDFEFSVATMTKLRPRHPLFDATSPNISAFKAAGGKLILWHGFSDPDMAPRVTIAYHEAIQRFYGDDVAAQFERLYLLPGVYHCGSGYGMAGVNFVSPLLQWVELGRAPCGIMTKAISSHGPLYSQSMEFVQRSRPVFPYPSLPKYTGKGDPNDGANYVQGPPLYHKLSPHWAGEDFFDQYIPSDGYARSQELDLINELSAIA